MSILFQKFPITRPVPKNCGGGEGGLLCVCVLSLWSTTSFLLSEKHQDL